MARNEEKHFCNLNRLILSKEKEEYDKAHPPRPKLSTLETPELIQKWLPSIKRDIDFYLKKSQVTCYSDAHVEESKEKVVKLEKEFKAFVRKIKKLSPSPLDVIPWTSRPYKRKKIGKTEETSFKEFKRIDTPILDDQKNCSLNLSKEDVTTSILYREENNYPSTPTEDNVSQFDRINWNLMDQPLVFSAATHKKKLEETTKTNTNFNILNLETKNGGLKDNRESPSKSVKMTAQIKRPLPNESEQHQKVNQADFINRIVNYDTSDDEDS